MFVTLIFYYLLTSTQDIYVFTKESPRVLDIIKQWAPLIWLAPNESFFPSNVELFLNRTVPVLDVNVKINLDTNLTLPIGTGSEKYYLVPRSIYDHVTDSAFLFGQNPSLEPVYVHATISRCSSSTEKCKYKKYVKSSTTLSDRLHFQVSYWFFYPYNEGKQVCFIGKIPTPMIFNSCLGKRKIMGNHVGDWEHMSLLFKGNNYPEEMYLAVHDAGAYYKFDPSTNIFVYQRQERRSLMQRPTFPKTVKFALGHPELFAAKGSHGLWSAPGEHYFVRVPKLYDNNGYGISWKTWENIKIYKLKNVPHWMKYRGRWGNPKARCMLFKKLGFCEVSDGPYGIPMKRRDFTC